MIGLEMLRNPETTAEEIAGIVSAQCPPVAPTECDRVSCRECWLAWLTTGEPPKKKEPFGEQTAPDEEGLHPNLIELYRKHKRLLQELSHPRETLAPVPPHLSDTAH